MKQIPRTPTQSATTSPVTHPATWQLLLRDPHSKKRLLFPSSVIWSSRSHRLSLQLHQVHVTFSTTAALQRGKDVQRQRKRTLQTKASPLQTPPCWRFQATQLCQTGPGLFPCWDTEEQRALQTPETSPNSASPQVESTKLSRTSCARWHNNP